MKRFENHPDELISASLSGDLTDLERRELDAHLATCPTCRETLEAFSQQRQLLSGLPVTRAPRDLGPRVRAGIESGRLGVPCWRRPGGLLAAGSTDHRSPLRLPRRAALCRPRRLFRHHRLPARPSQRRARHRCRSR